MTFALDGAPATLEYLLDVYEGYVRAKAEHDARQRRRRKWN